MKKTVQILWPLSVLLLVIQAINYYPDLPDMMASHFDTDGTPNTYSPKTDFIIIWYSLIVFLNIWVVLPKIIVKKLPPEFINIPNKEYWLASEERKDVLVGIVSTMMKGIFIASNCIMLYAFYYTVRINLGHKMDSNIGWMIIVILGIVAGSIFYMIKKTKKPSEV